MDKHGGSSKAHQKDDQGGGGYIKFLGVRRHCSGEKYIAQIYDHNKQRTVSLGFFTTAVEAARVYDRAAFQSRGDKAILNFPAEYRPVSSASASASTMAATSSSSMAAGEVFEFESLDGKLLEDLLDPNSYEKRTEIL